MFYENMIEFRKQRGVKNKEMCYKFLDTPNVNISDLKKSGYANITEIDRLLAGNIDFNNLITPDAKRMAASNIAIQASRQGAIDEAHVINGINYHLPDPYKFIKPKKTISFKKEGLQKTIDAVLLKNNIILGYAFLKLVSGGGGFQGSSSETEGSVGSETINFLKFASKRNDEKIWFAILDGDPVWKGLAEPYLSENVWAGNHVEIQEKVVERYGVELKEIDKTNPVKSPLEEFLNADAA